ncbi:MAG: S41 family peptidase [Candidatus Eremiobacteraeota bacterium]|nr:S41 family peptidase [Candidatus Eremiobacteraeota bacterium]
MNRLISFTFVSALLVSIVQIPAATHAAPTTLSALDATEIAFTYGKLTSEFYQRTSGGAIVAGARAEMEKTLRTAGIGATLPPIPVADNPQQTERSISREVSIAAKVSHGKVGAHVLAYSAISGMLGSVHDKYTVFLTPKEYASLNQSLDGKSFGGTGIVIQQDEQTKQIDVSNVIPDGPADKAGVQQDDAITAIDGIPTKGMAITEASKHLRGKEGTRVALTIVRDGKALAAPIVITRAIVHQLSVYQKMLPNKVGYVDLTVFGQSTGQELTQALDRLQRDGARAIVMDLRDNGGGYLTAALAVSSKFIPSGPIVSVESRASQITTLEADNTAIPPLPLAVLVNGYTASASEITSGAIQDSGVGTLIGTKTFGKGVVQTIYPLSDGSAVKITTARYLTPHNRDINHLGIEPDISVASKKGDRLGNPARDTQLQRALKFLDDKLARMGDAMTPSPGNTQRR